MAEMAHAGEDHGQAGIVRRGDNFLVAYRAARLNDRRGAGLRGGEQSVGKGKKGVGRNNRANRTGLRLARRLRRLGGFPSGDARLIDAAHLSGADAHRGAVFDIDDGVGFDVFANTERENHILHLSRAGCALADGS